MDEIRTIPLEMQIPPEMQIPLGEPEASGISTLVKFNDGALSIRGQHFISDAIPPAINAKQKQGSSANVRESSRVKVSSSQDFRELLRFSKILDLHVKAIGASDGDLKSIAGMNNITALDLRQTAVSDEGLKDIGTLSRLQTLSLSGTIVSDDGLKELKHPHLKELDISRTCIGPKGIENLKGVPELEKLILEKFQGTLSDDLLGALNELKNLKQVDIWGQANVEGLKQLKDCPTLKWLLFFPNNDFTEDELKQVSLALGNDKLVIWAGSTIRPDTGWFYRNGELKDSGPLNLINRDDPSTWP